MQHPINIERKVLDPLYVAYNYCKTAKEKDTCHHDVSVPAKSIACLKKCCYVL